MSKKKISANNDKASNFFNFIISLLPFILLILIGIIQGEITLHQKVFKTFLIFLFDSLLLITIFLYMFIKKDMTIIKRKYLLFFLLYLSYVFIQYIISFLSKEISYDRDYHLGNYILLIIFGFFFFLYIRNFLQIETGLLIINFFMLIVFIWSLYELIIKGFNFGNFRPELSFGNTDYFAGYIIGLLPLSLIGALIWFINYNETKKPFQLFLAISCLILSLIGIAPLIATQTKSAIFGWYIGYMLIFISCLILIQKKFVLRTKLIFSSVYLMIFIIIPIIFLLFPPPFIKLIFRRIFDAFNDFDFFLKDRIENGWAGALGLFKDHPLFGAGLGSVYPASFKYIGKFFYLYSSSNSFKHSHCEYVEILGEAGIFGIMIFSSLILFVIISLFKITFSDKYHIKFRLLSLGTCCGIISMLIHQIFSLSLRMSVTMTAFFFLMGLSIFIISYKNKALVDSIEEEKSVQNDHGNHKFFIPYFEKNITLKNFYIILIIILMLLIYSFILIMPVFNSENNIIKSEKSYIMAGNIYDQALQDEKNISNYASLFNKYIELSNKYIKNAIIIKPDNPYAWTQKYILDRDVNFKLTKDDDDVKAVLNDIKTDLDNLNSIIPGYQDVWSKYVEYYLNLSKYYISTGNFNSVNESLKKALEFIDKSLNSNYLNDYTHLNKLIILIRFKEKEKFYNAMEDYLKAKIYLDFARRKKIIREKIEIYISDITSLSEKNKIYTFNLSKKDILTLSDKYYNTNENLEYKYFQYNIKNDIENLFKNYYEETNK